MQIQHELLHYTAVHRDSFLLFPEYRSVLAMECTLVLAALTW